MTSEIEISKNIRKLIIDAFVLISSENLQLAYQKKVQVADVSSEIFCLWEDSYYPDGDVFQKGFSKDELDALKLFNIEFEEVCNESPDNLPHIEEVISTSYWLKYNRAAKKALLAFPVDEVNSLVDLAEKDYSENE